MLGGSWRRGSRWAEASAGAGGGVAASGGGGAKPFLNTINAHIDCEKQIVTVGFEGVSHEFNFSKFSRQPHEKESPSKDEIIALKRDIDFKWNLLERIKCNSKDWELDEGVTLEHPPSEKIRVEPSIAIIKDLLSDNVDGHDIHFCEDAARIAKPHARDKHSHVVGTPVVSVKIGDHCYHGLCDVGASVSAIPQSLYDEIKDEIAPIEIEPIDVTIILANRDTICPVAIVRYIEVLCGKTKYPADFLVLVTTQDNFCPIIFGRPFLNTINAHIDCEKQIVTVGFEGVSHEFNFSKFSRQPHEKELPSKDEIIALASISVPSTDPLEQYLLEHENDMHMDERDEIDRVIFEQYPILKNNLPVELLGEPPPPKGDPAFELEQLPDTLKFAYLDEKEIYPIIISASLSEHEEKKLLKTLRKHRAGIGYTLI
ncbi:hypothetical protein ZWY2020_019908 [Hordeum vulgare]|nr:hypothetical protein ZWY2020_019908 [Hordeum vulgare]